MPEAVLAILDDFQNAFSDEWKSLTSSSQESAAPEWRDYFHRVKGSGGTLGLARLQAESSALETAAQGDTLPTSHQRQAFALLLQASCQEARAFLQSLES